MLFVCKKPHPFSAVTRSFVPEGHPLASLAVADWYRYSGYGAMRHHYRPRPRWTEERSGDVVPAGKSFARKRIHHAMELMGACMILVAFLAMAILA